jgi:hypothetical protein
MTIMKMNAPRSVIIAEFPSVAARLENQMGRDQAATPPGLRTATGGTSRLAE